MKPNQTMPIKDKAPKPKNTKKTAKSPVFVRPQYYGEESVDFWFIIDEIKNKADAQELYSLGVALQNLEAQVLKRLSEIDESYVRL